MSKFLKLTGRIINTAHIQHVSHDKNAQKYSLHLATTNYSGFFMLGSGSINNCSNEIYATKEQHPESYKTIEKWINSLECVSNSNEKNSGAIP